jgi:hypothetical protein
LSKPIEIPDKNSCTSTFSAECKYENEIDNNHGNVEKINIPQDLHRKINIGIHVAPVRSALNVKIKSGKTKGALESKLFPIYIYVSIAF